MDHPVHSMYTTVTVGLLARGNLNIGLPIKKYFTVTCSESSLHQDIQHPLTVAGAAMA